MYVLKLNINLAFEIFLGATEKEWVLKQQFIVPAVSQTALFSS